ncbi:hypothetical protein E2C01_005474 [Portunus trituberculatus]|uniref:Uncharacterized protein n=1 Tax=Portunus trituberculatus TaxID=210409 RepID=A0A5B7CWR3_PORTR|nr:hypothetical protein [Portunus trituberculatus]
MYTTFLAACVQPMSGRSIQQSLEQAAVRRGCGSVVGVRDKCNISTVRREEPWLASAAAAQVPRRPSAGITSRSCHAKFMWRIKIDYGNNLLISIDPSLCKSSNYTQNSKQKCVPVLEGLGLNGFETRNRSPAITLAATVSGGEWCGWTCVGFPAFSSTTRGHCETGLLSFHLKHIPNPPASVFSSVTARPNIFDFTLNRTVLRTPSDVGGARRPYPWEKLSYTSVPCSSTVVKT